MLEVKKLNMRSLHRYLGFFLAGIMFVYALSGIILIYRDTDVFKIETTVKKILSADLDEAVLSKKIKIKNLKITKTVNEISYFEKGNYNKKTGEVSYLKMKLPFVLQKLNDLHKADTDHPLYWLNIFFGVSLLFFVVSAFWMFKPKSKHFQTGIRIGIAGSIFTFIILFI